MTKYLWRCLVFPLLAGIIITVLIHIYVVKWDGFFINLAVTLIGILITVLYVDWILEEHEHQRWLSTDKRISNRLKILLNSIISGLRDNLGLKIDVFDYRERSSFDEHAMHKILMNVGVNKISPDALSHVMALDQSGWVKLEKNIQKSSDDVISFLILFQNRLCPIQISDLLDLEASLKSSLTPYRILSDFLGVQKGTPPASNTPSDEFIHSSYKYTARAIQNICRLANKLSESIDYIKS